MADATPREQAQTTFDARTVRSIPGTFQIWRDCIGYQITHALPDRHVVPLLGMLRMMDSTGDGAGDFTVLQGDELSIVAIARRLNRSRGQVERAINAAVAAGFLEKITARRCERLAYRFILKDGVHAREFERRNADLIAKADSRRASQANPRKASQADSPRRVAKEHLTYKHKNPAAPAASRAAGSPDKPPAYVVPKHGERMTDAHCPARFPDRQKHIGRIFIKYDTPEWHAWMNKNTVDAKAKNIWPPPSINPTFSNGWCFPERWPPNEQPPDGPPRRMTFEEMIAA